MDDSLFLRSVSHRVIAFFARYLYYTPFVSLEREGSSIYCGGVFSFNITLGTIQNDYP